MRDQTGRQLGGGIGERDTSADSAAGPDGPVAHVRHRLGDQRRMAGDERRGLHGFVPRQRADDEPLRRQADPVEPGQAVDVDQRCGRGQAHVEGGHQALAAGQDAAVAAVALHQRQGLVERGGPMIGERGGLHAGILP